MDDKKSLMMKTNVRHSCLNFLQNYIWKMKKKSHISSSIKPGSTEVVQLENVDKIMIQSL